MVGRFLIVVWYNIFTAAFPWSCPASWAPSAACLVRRSPGCLRFPIAEQPAFLRWRGPHSSIRALCQGDDFISTLEDLGELRGLPCTLARFWEVGWLLMTAAALSQAGGFLSLLYPRHLERIVKWA